MVELTEADSNKWSKLIAHIARGESSGEPRDRNPHEMGDRDLWRPIAQRQRRFSAREELAVVADYADGGTVYSLAAKYGCHRATISRILKSHHIQLANAPIDHATIDEAIRLYESGLSMATAARHLGISTRSVFNFLHAAGAEIRSASPQASSKCR